MSCRIASVTSYLNENEAKNLQNGDVHPAQIADFGIGYLENHFDAFFFHFSRSSISA